MQTTGHAPGTGQHSITGKRDHLLLRTTARLQEASAGTIRAANLLHAMAGIVALLMTAGAHLTTGAIVRIPAMQAKHTGMKIIQTSTRLRAHLNAGLATRQVTDTASIKETTQNDAAGKLAVLIVVLAPLATRNEGAGEEAGHESRQTGTGKPHTASNLKGTMNGMILPSRMTKKLKR